MQPMKQPCHRTLELVVKLETLLRETKPLLFGGRKKTDVALAKNLLSEIEKVGDWSSIPHVVQFILQSDIEIAEAAGRSVDKLLKNIRPLQLPQLEELLGAGLYRYDRMKSWRELKSFDENKYVAKTSCFAVTAMMTLHKNGFIREPATRQLSQRNDGAELPYLLLRLADWVPQVRVVAESAIEQRIRSDYLHHFVHNIALLERIKQKQRTHGLARRTALIEHIVSELLHPTNRKIFLDGLRHKDIQVRRTLLKIVRDSGLQDLSEIIVLAIRDKDKTNRQIVVDMSNRLPHLDRLELLNRLLNDPSAFIRLESLRTLCDEQENSNTAQVISALLDRSSAVRDFARWKLKDIKFDIDFRQFYLEQIGSNKKYFELAAAVSALGELGVREDSHKVIPLMSNSSSILVQKAVLRTLARLDAKSYSDLFEQKLQSGAAGLSRTAANILQSTEYSITAEELWRIFTTTKFLHVQCNVLRLLDISSQWDRIAYYLLLASGDDPQFRVLALDKLQGWLKEFRTTWAYKKPTEKQIALLVNGMKTFPNKLPIELLKILQLATKSNP